MVKVGGTGGANVRGMDARRDWMEGQGGPTRIGGILLGFRGLGPLGGIYRGAPNTVGRGMEEVANGEVLAGGAGVLGLGSVWMVAVCGVSF